VDNSNGQIPGFYEYTLTDKTSGDDVKDIINYTIKDFNTGIESSTSLEVSILDDAPIGSDTAVTVELDNSDDLAGTTNLVIILDRSGSMDWLIDQDIIGSGPSRMDIAKNALNAMFDSLDTRGDVNVKFVTFSNDSTESSWFNDNIDGAKAYLNDVNPGGGTRYNQALDSAMSGYSPPEADRTLTYFISDGNPNTGYGITDAKELEWQNFLGANDIDIAYGIGITNSVDAIKLAPIAYPNTKDGINEPYVTTALNANDLKSFLLETVEETVFYGETSTFIESGDNGIIVGADGASIHYVVYKGVEYTQDSSNTISISTDHHGIFQIDSQTGDYFYTVSTNDKIDPGNDTFQITAIDGDGDLKTVDLVVTLKSAEVLDANTDHIITNQSPTSALTIKSEILLHNDSGADSIDSVNNATGGSVSGTDTIIFADGSTPSIYSVITEPDSDSDLNGLNNTIETAFDLTDRSVFGVVTGNQADVNSVVDPSLASVKYVGKFKEDDISSGNQKHDVDWLKVSLSAGEKIILDIENGQGGVDSTDTLIAVFNTDKNLVSYNDNESSNSKDSYLEYVASEDGVYYIQVTSYDAQVYSRDDAGDYQLWISIDEVDPYANASSFEYQISDFHGTDTTVVDINYQEGNTLTGSDKDEVLRI